MLNHIKATIIALSLTTIGACVTLYNPTGGNDYIKGNKLAVISGTNAEINFKLAEQLTKDFTTHSKFSVISQSEIRQKLGTYPLNIKGPFRMGIASIFDDFNATDISKLREIQIKLEVDNLYVIWTTREEIIEHVIHQTPTYLHLYAFPSGKEVGRGKFNMGYNERSVTTPNNWDGIIRAVSPLIVKDVLGGTGYRK